ncbi:hypothetical protein C266_19745 [Pandoraea sp. SD6-2]|nr:hypothetical protein C266_19745 [Pandoraea sp. SD6-2]
MCNVETFFRTDDEYGLRSFDVETRNDGVSVSYSNLPFNNYLRATCRFDTVQDVRDAGFDEVLWARGALSIAMTTSNVFLLSRRGFSIWTGRRILSVKS